MNRLFNHRNNGGGGEEGRERGENGKGSEAQGVGRGEHVPAPKGGINRSAARPAGQVEYRESSASLAISTSTARERMPKRYNQGAIGQGSTVAGQSHEPTADDIVAKQTGTREWAFSQPKDGVGCLISTSGRGRSEWCKCVLIKEN